MFVLNKFHWRYYLAVLIAIGGIATGLWTIVEQRKAHYINNGVELPAIPRVDPETAGADFYDMNPTADTIEQASAAVAQAAQEAMVAIQWKGERAPEDAQSLVDEIQQATAMYLAGSAQSYEEYVASHGLSLPTGWKQNKERFADSFALTFETLRLAPLNTRQIVIRPRYIDGEAITYDDDTHTSVNTAYRPERLPRSGTVDRGLLQAYEVIVPAKVVDYEVAADSNSLGKKSSSRARFGLWFKMDRSSRQWILMKVAIYDIPRNTAVVMPPL